ncbi:hypothetical protein [Indiicoccus explosivorum]|uniref:hypothetical protein n=1 Tax=Indiicoccus explosivorum TaxID=1917864 RepID=UPI000B44F2FD|nr:hypothetical protein [Indiicoccus explosivorum]
MPATMPIKYEVSMSLAKKLSKRDKRFRVFRVRPSNQAPARFVLTITFKQLTKLKATHRFIPSKDFPQRKLTDLTQYTNVDDVRLKRAPVTTLEGTANAFILASERAEQAAIRADPPVYCRGYVERADYPLTSLYSDYKDMIEASTLLFMLRLQAFGTAAWATLDAIVTWDDYRDERKKWRRCRHKFCLNYFPVLRSNFKGQKTKRIDAGYCCEGCKTDAKNAETRFKQTGSYLPVHYYLPRQSDSVGDSVRDHENATPAEDIEKQKDRNKPERFVPVKNDRSPIGEMRVFKSKAEAEAAYIPAKNARRIA